MGTSSQEFVPPENSGRFRGLLGYRRDHWHGRLASYRRNLDHGWRHACGRRQRDWWFHRKRWHYRRGRNHRQHDEQRGWFRRLKASWGRDRRDRDRWGHDGRDHERGRDDGLRRLDAHRTLEIHAVRRLHHG
jgi:hypothetical protein